MHGLLAFLAPFIVVTFLIAAFNSFTILHRQQIEIVCPSGEHAVVATLPGGQRLACVGGR